MTCVAVVPYHRRPPARRDACVSLRRPRPLAFRRWTRAFCRASPRICGPVRSRLWCVLRFRHRVCGRSQCGPGMWWRYRDVRLLFDEDLEAGGGGGGGPGPCMRHHPAPPPPPQVLKDCGAGAMAPTAPNFLSHASLKGVLCLWSLRPLRLSSRQRQDIAIIAYIPLYPHAPRHPLEVCMW